jgi:hypothetical protein
MFLLLKLSFKYIKRQFPKYKHFVYEWVIKPVKV